MDDFQYHGQELFSEKIPVQKIASEIGTPFYLHSYNTILNHLRVFTNAFKEIPHLICFAEKANSNIAILRIFIQEGGGLDIISGGDVLRDIFPRGDVLGDIFPRGDIILGRLCLRGGGFEVLFS